MPDYLSCGSCPVDFELADIVSFIEHKRQRCIDGSVVSDQLECIKCCKKFHTPWPLLIHIQMDHEILIVRNLNQLSLPLGFKTSVTPLVQSDEMSMDSDQDGSSINQNHKDVFTQTSKRNNTLSCCQPRLLPACCQKIEPQCYDEPCICPSVSDVICTSEACFINRDSKDLENETGNCYACPQGTTKKESREVQTELEYNEDVDINFLLTNSSDSTQNFISNIDESFSQHTTPFTTQPYGTDFHMTTDKSWSYYVQAGNHNNNNNSNYIDTFNNPNYQMLMPNINHSSSNTTNYVPSNTHLMATSPRSLTSSPNQQIADKPLFPPITTDHNHLNHNPQFLESNNSFRYRGINTQESHTLVNSLLMPNSPHSHKDSTPLFPRNENCPLPLIPSCSDLSTDYNNDNYENEKIENEKKEFRFLCPNCSKRFRQKVHLRKHVMSQHARQKPHKCSQCGYTTVEKSHLTVHIRTHTGERPYTCRRCSYSSAQNCTLKSHYLRRHPGDQIDCLLCGSYFITEQERNNHQRSCRIVNGISHNGHSGINDQNPSENNVDHSKHT